MLFSFRGQATHTSAVSLARTLGLPNTLFILRAPMKTSTPFLLSLASPFVTACSSTKIEERGAAQSVESAKLPFSSPECLAAKLPLGEPFPASAIPPAAQTNRQSGLVAIRYDVVAGAAQNLQVVTSSPSGLYDSAAMQHAAKYRAPTSINVRGCVTIVEVKF